MSEAILKLLSSEQLFDPNPGPPSPYYAIIGFFFAVILGASLSTYLRRDKISGGRAVLRKLLTRAAVTGFLVGGVGVVLVLARFLGIPILSMRILLYLTIIVALGLAGYLVYYVRRVFPQKRAARERGYLRNRYLPKPAPKISSRKKKGKRRK